jgi:hypothetical protein
MIRTCAATSSVEWHNRRTFPQDAQKSCPARPQASRNRRRTFPHPPVPELSRQLVSRVGYAEDSEEARTLHGKRRVSARRGRAGEKSDFFSILLHPPVLMRTRMLG